MLKINLEIARRFILGKQGLWPGRRWRGIEGTEQAMREMEYLQLDPLQIIARSQDIQLHSRVLDCKPSMWEEVAYQQRKFFDWGGWLATRPMDELPYWRVVMHRERDNSGDVDSRVHHTADEHAEAIAEMRDILRERGVVNNREFEMASRKRTESYRGRKDSALALYYLWRTGEIMTHHRENFERVYALTEAIAPAHLIYEKSDEEADKFLIKKEISFSGIAVVKRTGDTWGRGVPFPKYKALVAGLLADSEILEVQVEGWKAIHYMLASDLPMIEELSAGRVPMAWTPLETSTGEEAVFLSPLDQVSARGRAKTLFGFDYVWEVYKKVEQRKYGYYTLPVLWGDKLVARFDSKFDKTSKTFIILGLWLEDEALAKDETFVEALAAAFARFQTFLGANTLDASAVKDASIRKRLSS